jgi:hypothetical protein
MSIQNRRDRLLLSQAQLLVSEAPVSNLTDRRCLPCHNPLHVFFLIVTLPDVVAPMRDARTRQMH